MKSQSERFTSGLQPHAGSEDRHTGSQAGVDSALRLDPVALYTLSHATGCHQFCLSAATVVVFF